MKTFKYKLRTTTIILLLVTFFVNAQEFIEKPLLDAPYQSITNEEEMIMYVNAQHLVSKWNNIIIHAKTGKEQLDIMNKSGVFAQDVKLTFDFGDGKPIQTTGLTEEPLPFYSQFIDTLKKNRFNMAANVDVVEFGKDYLRFNFKHTIFMNEELSLVGENQVIMHKDGDRYFISSAYIRVILNNTQHAY